MMKRCPLTVSIALLIVVVARPSQAQTSTVTNAGVSLAETLSALSGVAGLGFGGEFLQMNTALEIATMPFAASSGGGAKKLDPTK